MSSLVHSEFEASLGGKKSSPDPLPAKKKWCLVYIASQDSQGYVENTVSGSFGESWILQNKETLSQTEILKLEQVQRQDEGAQCHPFTEQATALSSSKFSSKVCYPFPAQNPGHASGLFFITSKQ